MQGLGMQMSPGEAADQVNIINKSHAHANQEGRNEEEEEDRSHRGVLSYDADSKVYYKRKSPSVGYSRHIVDVTSTDYVRKD